MRISTERDSPYYDIAAKYDTLCPMMKRLHGMEMLQHQEYVNGRVSILSQEERNEIARIDTEMEKFSIKQRIKNGRALVSASKVVLN